MPDLCFHAYSQTVKMWLTIRNRELTKLGCILGHKCHPRMTQKGEMNVGRNSVLIYPTGWERRKGRDIIKPEANPPGFFYKANSSEISLYHLYQNSKRKRRIFILIQRRFIVLFFNLNLFLVSGYFPLKFDLISWPQEDFGVTVFILSSPFDTNYVLKFYWGITHK